MKNLFILLLLVVICTAGTADTGPVQLSLSIILAIIAGCYEVISRLIPTSACWSIIGKVLEVLIWLSKLFDRKKS